MSWRNLLGALLLSIAVLGFLYGVSMLEVAVLAYPVVKDARILPRAGLAIAASLSIAAPLAWFGLRLLRRRP